MNIFTLKNEMAGEIGKALNGKIFYLKMSANKCTQFIFVDLINIDIIWETDPVITRCIDNGNVTLYTKSGEVYELLNLVNIIPTKCNEPIIVINRVTENKNIKYGNSYNRIHFEFNRPITENEFIEYLVANKYEIKDKDDYNRNYSIIEGINNKWTYTWINSYIN